MIRFIFRFLALSAFAIAILFAVADATRSVAQSAFAVTSLGESWFAVSPDSLNAAQALVQRHVFPQFWDPVMIFILKMPGFVVFALLALIFYLIGKKPRHARGRFP